MLPVHPILATNSPQASVYGKCIVADYNAVHKDKCLTEFMRLKDCYTVRNFLQSGLITEVNVSRLLQRRSKALDRVVVMEHQAF